MDAIVLAGGRIGGDFGQREGVTIKALLAIDGITLLERAVRAIRHSRHVERICVVGPWEVEGLARCVGADVYVEAQGAGIDNLLRGFDALDPSARILCSACDLPFLRPSDIDSVIELSPPDAQVTYTIISRAEWQATFPDAQALFVPLSDGFYTGGCVHVIDMRAIRQVLPLVQKLFAARKSQTAMARLLGLGLTMRLLAARHVNRSLGPSTEQARRRAESLIGCRCAIVRGCSPRIAADVDDETDWRYVLDHQNRLWDYTGESPRKAS